MNERDEARALLRELLGEMIGANGNGNGHHPPAPAVPAPPVPAVFRPSTWRGPVAPGEVVGGAASSPDAGEAPGRVTVPPPESSRAASGRGARESLGERAAPAPSLRGRVETVVIDDDSDLDAFVRVLLAMFENPRDRMAIRAGQLRFSLRRPPASSDGAVMRVERGAVTERVVRDAASRGARLVLAPAAVLTPLAREKARALKVEIERERRC